MPLLFARRFARGDDADSVAFRPIAVHDDQDAQTAAQTKENEAVFVIGVIGVVNQASPFICEDALRFLEGHAVLLLVRTRLDGIPFEAKRCHMHIVRTQTDKCKENALRSSARPNVGDKHLRSSVLDRRVMHQQGEFARK